MKQIGKHMAYKQNNNNKKKQNNTTGQSETKQIKNQHKLIYEKIRTEPQMLITVRVTM